MKIAGKITRGFLIALEIAAAGFFIIPMTGRLVSLGNVFGLALSLICLGATVFWKPLFRLLKKLWSRKWGKALLLTAETILGLLVLYACILSAAMVGAAVKQPQSPDAVIVLGCKVSANGRPSLMLSRRIDAAYSYLSENQDVICVVSGGQGANEPYSEAAVMKAYLVEMGIDEQRILLEDKSTSTGENLEFSLELLRQEGIQAENIAVITDCFHQLRSAIMSDQLGAEAYAVNADTPFWLVPTYWVREWFALSQLFVFGR